MEEDDKYLAYFDKRYVETIEQENNTLRTKIYQLQNAFYAQQMKSSTLVEYLAKANNELRWHLSVLVL